MHTRARRIVQDTLTAVALMLDLLNGADGERTKLVPVELVVRASTDRRSGPETRS